MIAHYKFPASKGWEQTSEFFKTVDFYNAAERLAVSMKSTKVTDVNNWLKQPKVASNFKELQNALINGTVGNGANEKTINKVQMMIIVPLENYSDDMVKTWKAAIKKEYPNIWVDIDILEKHLK